MHYAVGYVVIGCAGLVQDIIIDFTYTADGLATKQWSQGSNALVWSEDFNCVDSTVFKF